MHNDCSFATDWFSPSLSGGGRCKYPEKHPNTITIFQSQFIAAIMAIVGAKLFKKTNVQSIPRRTSEEPSIVKQVEFSLLLIFFLHNDLRIFAHQRMYFMVLVRLQFILEGLALGSVV